MGWVQSSIVVLFAALVAWVINIVLFYLGIVV